VVGLKFLALEGRPDMAQLNEARAPRRFQFSLVMLLALTGWVAILCLALKTPTPVWATAMFLLSLLAALAGGLGILYRTGRSRVFAVGFFAGCLSYAACLFITEKHFGGQFANENEMPTTQFASWLFARLHPQSVNSMSGGGYGGSGMGGMGGGMMGGGGMGGGGFFSVDSSLAADQGAAGDSTAPYGSEGMGGMDSQGMPGAAGPPVPPAPIPTFYNFKHFVVIVHSALAMLMGLAGGIIAQLLYAARREASHEQEPRAA
jgi:hypothetical protein